MACAWPDLTRAYTLDWNLESPDGSIWTPSITTGGVVSFAWSASGTATAAPIFLGLTGTVFAPTIDNSGILSYSETGDAGQNWAAIQDSAGDIWKLVVTGAEILQATTAPTLPGDRCGYWGDGGSWGDGGLYCNLEAEIQSYLVVVDSQRPLLWNWTLESPDGNVWVPTVSTGGVVTFEIDASAFATTVPHAIDSTGTPWQLSISNSGILSAMAVTDDGQAMAANLDADGTVWYWEATTGGILTLNSSDPRATVPMPHRVQVAVKHSGSMFTLHSLLVNLQNRLEDAFQYYVSVDRDCAERIQVRIKHSGSAFRVDTLRPMVKVKRYQEVS